jgi:hypothetical protein
MTIEIVLDFALMYAPSLSAIVDLIFATYVSLCIAGFFRHPDTIGIFADENGWFDNHLELFIQTRTNDQLRFGSIIVIAFGNTPACPAKLVKRFITEAHLDGKHVPLFQGFNGQRNSPTRYSTVKPSTTTSAATTCSNASAKATAMPLGEVTKRYGTQSMHGGGATTVANMEIPDRLFKRHGGWCSDSAKDRYVADSLEKRLAVTQALGL